MRCLKIPKKSSNESRLDASLHAVWPGRTRWETGHVPLLGFRDETDKPEDLFLGKACGPLRSWGSWRELVWSWLISENRELRHSMLFRFVIRKLFFISTKYSELSRVKASHKA